MINDQLVITHYTHGNLLEAIKTSFSRIGKSPDQLTIDDLAVVDEFHIGGREATEHLIRQLNITGQKHFLDVGCGLGGAARYVSNRHKINVTGVDICKEYIETGRAMNKWVGLDDKVDLKHSNAHCLPYRDKFFDGGYMLHVGMNIDDKYPIFEEIGRVLRPGALFAIYDVMRIKVGEPDYPLPWASKKSMCKMATPEQYKQDLMGNGLTVINENNRLGFAIDQFNKMKESPNKKNDYDVPGLNILMQEDAAIRTGNLIKNMKKNFMAPIEILVMKQE